MLVDSHCHLDFPDFEEERDQIVERARQAGVRTLVTISTRVRQFDRLRPIIEKYDDIWASIGTHPLNAGEEPDVSSAEIIEISALPKVVAIGEAGLDYFYDRAPRNVQHAVFRKQIGVSRDTGLPLVIHARDADEDMAAILQDETGKGAFPFNMDTIG